MWAAGFWDGEGSCYLSKKRRYVNLSVAQRQPEVLHRFRDAFNLGEVKENRLRGKPLYRWTITKFADVSYVRDLLISRVSPVKRLQFERVFAAAKQDVSMHGSVEHFQKVIASRRANRGVEFTA